jgi:hypothetical protein
VISKSLNQKPESVATSAITGKSYRMLLHGKRKDPEKPHRLERIEAAFHPVDVSVVRAALFDRLPTAG